MPSPIAHPAASIPFTKTGLVFSALVIGSISPDFWYIFRVGSAFYGYTLPGLFLFDLPVAFILLWLFQTLGKWPLLSLLPVGLQRRLFHHAQGFKYGPWKHFGIIVISLLVGALTHIVWDSFTHDYGWMVEHFTFLSMPVAGQPLYALLQNLSTLVGVALLVFWFLRWLPKAPRGDRMPAHFSSRVQGIFLSLTGLSLVLVEGSILSGRLLDKVAHRAGHFMSAGSLTFSALFIICFFIGIYCVAWMIAFHKTIRRTD